MHRKTITSLLVVGAITMAAAFGAITYRSVFAQAPTPTPDTPTQPAQPGDQASQPGSLPERLGDKGLRGGHGGYSEEDLAAALGITTDQLQTAYQTANAEAIKEAVSQGLITQEQADQLSAIGSDTRGFGRFGMRELSGIDYEALLAKALGISTDELKAGYQQAYAASLDAAVQNGTMTQEQADLAKARNSLFSSSKFQSSLTAAFETAVNQAVTDGLITQAQADQIIQEQSQDGAGFFGRGMGGFGGPHGGRPGRGQPFNQAVPTQTAPSTSPTSGL